MTVFMPIYKINSNKRNIFSAGQNDRKRNFFLYGKGTLEPLLLFVLQAWMISRNTISTRVHAHTHNFLCVCLNKKWAVLDILKVNFKEHFSFTYLSNVSVNINTLRFLANNSGSSTENRSKMKVFQMITSIHSLMFEGFCPRTKFQVDACFLQDFN